MKKYCTLILLLLMMFSFSGCGTGNADYKEKGYNYIATYDFNGGFMNNSVTEITDHIKYAYTPGSTIIPPQNLPSCKILKDGYEFTGWFKDAECTQPWDFKNDKIETESLTLYAGWKYVTKYTYTLYYIESGSEKSIYTYSVDEGEKFVDYLKKANSVSGKTPIGFYSDSSYSTPWDENYTHPGGADDLDIKVYVNYIEGEYTLVKDYNSLVAATGNIYLLNDIDCGGKVLDFGKKFDRIIQGNNYTISNFVVNAQSGLQLYYGIFNELNNAKIYNITFANYTINSPEKKSRDVQLTCFAGKVTGDETEIKNVKLQGCKIVLNNIETTNSYDAIIDRPMYEGSNDNFSITFETPTVIDNRN